MPPPWRVREVGRLAPPHVTIAVIEGAAHAMNFSHPGELAHVIDCWLDGREITDDPDEPGRAQVLEIRTGRPVIPGGSLSEDKLEVRPPDRLKKMGAIGEGRMTQVGRAAETPDVAPETGAQPTGQQPSKARHWRYSLPGLAGALVFVCLSLSPSLLPRTGVIQGLVCGITAAIGYGVGVVAAWVWRAFADRVPRRTTHRSWRVFAVVSCVCLVAAMTFGRYWQGQIRMRMGVAPDGLSSLLVTPLLAALVFVALIASARTLRGLYRWAARRLERWIGPRAAHAVGWTAVVVADRTARQRSGTRRPRGCSRRGLLSTERSHRTGGRAAGRSSTVRECRIPRAVDVARQAGPQLHWHRPDSGADRGLHGQYGEYADPGLRRSGLRRDRGAAGTAGRRGSCTGRRVRQADPCGDHDHWLWVGRSGGG